MNMVALIPARADSKRVPRKSFRSLCGRPLMDYTAFAAIGSGVFSEIIFATDAAVAWAGEPDITIYRRATVPDDQPDIVWVREVLHSLARRPDAFAILRPTSPFRTAATIQRAYRQFTLPDQTADSIRAVEPAKQSPYKMFTCEGPGYPLRPLFDYKHPDGTPFHSSPTQTLPIALVQNASLEMSWTANVETHGTISGRKIAAFYTTGLEGFDINDEADWREAEYLARTYPDCLPAVDVARVSPAPAAQ